MFKRSSTSVAEKLEIVLLYLEEFQAIKDYSDTPNETSVSQLCHLLVSLVRLITNGSIKKETASEKTNQDKIKRT